MIWKNYMRFPPVVANDIYTLKSVFFIHISAWIEWIEASIWTTPYWVKPIIIIMNRKMYIACLKNRTHTETEKHKSMEGLIWISCMYSFALFYLFCATLRCYLSRGGQNTLNNQHMATFVFFFFSILSFVLLPFSSESPSVEVTTHRQWRGRLIGVHCSCRALRISFWFRRQSMFGIE